MVLADFLGCLKWDQDTLIQMVFLQIVHDGVWFEAWCWERLALRIVPRYVPGDRARIAIDFIRHCVLLQRQHCCMCHCSQGCQGKRLPMDLYWPIPKRREVTGLSDRIEQNKYQVSKTTLVPQFGRRWLRRDNVPSKCRQSVGAMRIVVGG